MRMVRLNGRTYFVTRVKFLPTTLFDQVRVGDDLGGSAILLRSDIFWDTLGHLFPPLNLVLGVIHGCLLRLGRRGALWRSTENHSINAILRMWKP